MNGMFGNFRPPMQFYTPQQNVANYLRAPVVQATSKQQYPSMLQFISAFNQSNTPPMPKEFEESSHPLGKLIGAAMISNPEYQNQYKKEKEAALMLQKLANGFNANR